MDVFSEDGINEFMNTPADQLTGDKLPWIVKYRPKTVDEVILPDEITNMVKFGMQNNEFTHYIFHSGNPGSGKTSLAVAIPETINADYKFFTVARGSMDLLDDIKEYSKQANPTDKPRFVILDEVDRPSEPARFFTGLQPLIESTTNTLRFILTCNNIHIIPEPIRSRCAPISFSYSKNDDSLKRKLFHRMKEIAETETAKYGGTYDKKALAEIAKDYYPDIRSILQAMYVNFLKNNGSILAGKGDVVSFDVDHIWELVSKKDFDGTRDYINGNIVDFASLYPLIGNKFVELIPKEKRMEFAVLLGKYQFQSAYPAVDQEINMMAFLSSVMRIL
jgi:DNA polymerase III, gamma/tau subunits